MLWYVQTKQEFTAQELADEFQLSVRSIYRYISDLADLGVYIESKKGRNGGFTVLPNQVLPPVLFTEAELFSLYFAIQSLTNYEDFPFKVNTITAREKLLEVVSKETRQKLLQLSDHFQISVPKQAVSAPYLNQLITACLNHTVLTIGYQSVRRVSQKNLEPIGLYTSNGFWYLFAFDQDVKEARHFRIDRIQTLAVTNETFTADLSFKQIENEYQPQVPIEISADLTERGMKQCLENRYLYKGVQKAKEGQAKLSMMIDKSDLAYTAEFFLVIGKEAKVTAPKELVKLLEEKVKQLGKIYG